MSALPPQLAVAYLRALSCDVRAVAVHGSGGACLATCQSDLQCVMPATCDTGIGRCTAGPKCTDYCNEMAADCTAGNLMYSSLASCLGVCATLPQGTLADTSWQKSHRQGDCGRHNEASYESSQFPDVPDRVLQLFHFEAGQLTQQHRRLRVEAMLRHCLQPDEVLKDANEQHQHRFLHLSQCEF